MVLLIKVTSVVFYFIFFAIRKITYLTQRTGNGPLARNTQRGGAHVSDESQPRVWRLPTYRKRAFRVHREAHIFLTMPLARDSDERTAMVGGYS